MEDKRPDSAWGLFKSPYLSTLSCAVAFLMFDDEFSGYLANGDWISVVILPILMWAWFLVCYGIATIMFVDTIARRPWFQNVKRKWQVPIAAAFTILFFVVSYWFVHRILLR